MFSVGSRAAQRIGARQVWVTETALSTALQSSYMASQLALFGIVVGVALLLAGIGFGVLVFGGALCFCVVVFPFRRAHEQQIDHAVTA